MFEKYFNFYGRYFNIIVFKYSSNLLGTVVYLYYMRNAIMSQKPQIFPTVQSFPNRTTVLRTVVA